MSRCELVYETFVIFELNVFYVKEYDDWRVCRRAHIGIKSIGVHIETEAIITIITICCYSCRPQRNRFLKAKETHEISTRQTLWWECVSSGNCLEMDVTFCATTTAVANATQPLSVRIYSHGLVAITYKDLIRPYSDNNNSICSVCAHTNTHNSN